MAETKELRLRAQDMTCTGCAMDMENILREKEGVREAIVNFSDSTITVRYDPAVLDEKAIYMAVRRLGFKTDIIR